MIAVTGVDAIYSTYNTYCYSNPTTASMNVPEYAFVSTIVGIPPIVCFVSFVVCAANLVQSRVSAASAERNIRAATTVAIFTGLFLACNLPYFVNSILYTITLASPHSYPGPLFSGIYMYWYSWQVCKIACVLLNAVLNPVLYYWKIPEFADWVWERWGEGDTSVELTARSYPPARNGRHVIRRNTATF